MNGILTFRVSKVGNFVFGAILMMVLIKIHHRTVFFWFISKTFELKGFAAVSISHVPSFLFIYLSN